MNKTRFSILTAVMLLLSGCGSHSAHEGHDDHDGHDHNHEHEHTPAHSHKEGHVHHEGEETEEEEEHNPDEIILTPVQAKAAGVVVTPVTLGEFSSVMKCGGRILTATGDESTVVAPASGIVSMKKGYDE